MARGAAVFGDQIEPVFDVVVGFCAVSCWVGMGSSVKSRPSHSSRIQAGPSRGGVHSNLTDRSPLFSVVWFASRCQSAFKNHFTVDGQHR